MAAPVPRHIRQSRLGYIPINCIIATRTAKGDRGDTQAFDIIMLPADQFQRMKNNVSLQHVLGPSYSPNAGGTFHASFILTDIKEVLVPGEEADPEAHARNHFLLAFNILTPGIPAASPPPPEKETPPPKSPFSAAARECTVS